VMLLEVSSTRVRAHTLPLCHPVQTVAGKKYQQIDPGFKWTLPKDAWPVEILKLVLAPENMTLLVLNFKWGRLPEAPGQVAVCECRALEDERTLVQFCDAFSQGGSVLTNLFIRSTTAGSSGGGDGGEGTRGAGKAEEREEKAGGESVERVGDVSRAGTSLIGVSAHRPLFPCPGPLFTAASLLPLGQALVERALERVQILVYGALLDSAPEKVDVDGSLVQGLTQLISRYSARGKEQMLDTILSASLKSKFWDLTEHPYLRDTAGAAAGACAGAAPHKKFSVAFSTKVLHTILSMDSTRHKF